MDPVSAHVASASEAPTTESSATARPNGRKGSKKVRTGCITCKVRRVKCDEAKPACVRCTSTGRRCDGYLSKVGTASTARYSTSAIKPIPGHPSTLALFHSNSSSPRNSPSFFAGWDPSEQRAFDFYMARSSVHLFRRATTHFWSRIIPSLCFQEPAIRHAAIVISDVHEGEVATFSLSNNSGFPSLSPFAASHYGRALRATSNWTAPDAGIFAGSASIAVPLLACAMFIPIAFMCGDEEAGQMHIHLGRRILATFDGNMNSPGAELIRKELVPIFTRCNVAGFLFGYPPPPIPQALRWTRTLLESDAPMVFDSATEAEQALNEVMEDGLRFWREQTDACQATTPRSSARARERQTSLLARLQKWNKAFATLRSIKPLEVDDGTAKINDLYHLTARTFVQRALLGTKEAAGDPSPVTFERVIVAASKIIEENEQLKAQQQPTAFMARKTHEIGLSDADVLELRKQMVMDCYENMWNAWRVVQVSQRAAAMEEQRATKSEASCL